MIGNIREALTSNREERNEITERYNIREETKALWSGGNICGQCQSFNPLGNLKGMNGTCKHKPSVGYIKPEDVACNKIERLQDE